LEKIKERSTFVYIDLYDQVVNGYVVDMGFNYDCWQGQYQLEDQEKRIFNLKVRGYFNED
jgi:hypothetical protein